MNVHPPCQDVNTLFAILRNCSMAESRSAVHTATPHVVRLVLQRQLNYRPDGNVSSWREEPDWSGGYSRLNPGPRLGSGIVHYDVAALEICSPKAERRQSRLASKPSAFCWLSASGIAPVRVWLTVNVHPACQDVNTLFTGSRKSPPRRQPASTRLMITR